MYDSSSPGTVGKSFQELPSPVKEILKKDYGYNKWTQVRLHQDPYLKTEIQKREAIPIIETGITKPSFKTKHKMKRIIVQCLCLEHNLNQKQMLH